MRFEDYSFGPWTFRELPSRLSPRHVERLIDTTAERTNASLNIDKMRNALAVLRNRHEPPPEDAD